MYDSHHQGDHRGDAGGGGNQHRASGLSRAQATDVVLLLRLGGGRIGRVVCLNNQRPPAFPHTFPDDLVVGDPKQMTSAIRAGPNCTTPGVSPAMKSRGPGRIG